MTTTPEAQIALDRNEQRADTFQARYLCRDYGHASRREKDRQIGRYRLADGTDILAYGANYPALCMPEELPHP